MRTPTQRKIESMRMNIDKLADDALVSRMAVAYHSWQVARDTTFRDRWQEIYEACKKEALARMGHELTEE